MTEMINANQLRNDLQREIGLILAELDIQSALYNGKIIESGEIDFSFKGLSMLLDKVKKIISATEQLGVLKGKMEMIEFIIDRYNLTEHGD